MKNVKIALVGGPCGGKTSSVYDYKDRLSKKYNVAVINETAASLLNLGYLDEYKMSLIDFQNLLFKIQFINEYYAEKNSEILLCDRGIIDARAYISNKDFAEIINLNKVNEKEIFSTYNCALYFRTIAYEFPELFKFERIYESPESAIERDKIELRIWKDKILKSKYENINDFADKKEKIYFSLEEYLKNSFNLENKNLSDYYSQSYVKQMINGIEEIIYNNDIPNNIKNKTLELIK